MVIIIIIIITIIVEHSKNLLIQSVMSTESHQILHTQKHFASITAKEIQRPSYLPLITFILRVHQQQDSFTSV